jgi:hypothetical protein
MALNIINMVQEAVVIFGTISGGVVAIVAFVKSLLMQVEAFVNATDQERSLVLQIVAFIAGVALAFTAQVNILALFPQFNFVSPEVGLAVTGLICSGGSQLFYAVLIFLAGKVIIPPPGDVTETQTVAVRRRGDYVPFS